MAGPDRSVKGGISSVVNAYYAAGLDRRCELTYVPTVKSEHNVGKALDWARGHRAFGRELSRADVVHLHVSVRGSMKRKRVLARMAHEAGKPLVLHNHAGEFAKYFEAGDDRYRESVRELYGWADRVVVLSEEWRDYFAEKVCDSGKIVVLHNAVPVPEDGLGSYAGRDVLFLGRLGPCKSPDVLLHAASSVLREYPDVRFRFGGDGDARPYRELAEKLGIAGSCEFLGWVSGEQKEDLIRRSGIYCLPSRNEGMPMSVLEAMSYGLPTVATPVGGTPQIIRDGRNGYMTPVGDSEALAARLCELMSDEALRRRIGEAGRETVRKSFNIENNIEQLVGIYESL